MDLLQKHYYGYGSELFFEFSGSQGDEYEDHSLTGCSAM
jgi:hypothetical protein